ncbi:phosphoribosylanthranilate isomerase [Desmospora activa]|uniref:N-(5'-phosphoribosyl)anthranilate isomerase n=1 Tax=Desmospora activa DSM 45169 TaxID=1121389 RepID=A0A2T4Z9X1_9BACL|nr:phosphoribosylanthranilate isomerase [Desmospora activa]PTM58688.1 phosphoribosylanthranilate isomerase [Desmospora activa DSM 45169]
MSRTMIKLCGLQVEEDVKVIQELDVDAAGFILVPQRKRTVTPERIRRLQVLLPPSVRTIAVMMDPTAEEVESLLQTVRVDGIQLHGEESPAFCRRLKAMGVNVIKVFHMKAESDEISDTETYAPWIDHALLDSVVAGVHGGSGKRFAWERIPAIRQQWHSLGVPLWVAGGINPENVTELLGYGLDGVDVSSGIETAGRKNPVLMKRLVERVRQVEQCGIAGKSR